MSFMSFSPNNNQIKDSKQETTSCLVITSNNTTNLDTKTNVSNTCNNNTRISNGKNSHSNLNFSFNEKQTDKKEKFIECFNKSNISISNNKKDLHVKSKQAKASNSKNKNENISKSSLICEDFEAYSCYSNNINYKFTRKTYNSNIAPGAFKRGNFLKLVDKESNNSKANNNNKNKCDENADEIKTCACIIF
jgi:hypothetical protein